MMACKQSAMFNMDNVTLPSRLQNLTLYQAWPSLEHKRGYVTKVLRQGQCKYISNDDGQFVFDTYGPTHLSAVTEGNLTASAPASTQKQDVEPMK